MGVCGYDELWRFIPTCMGNSEARWEIYPTYSVHPHVHGELRHVYFVEVHRSGSSPRAWGTRPSGLLRSVRSRFIPTCMGNSGTLLRFGLFRSVHPHVHGELVRTLKLMFLVYGSSPRAWGTLVGETVGPHWARFIPTCMGNSPGSIGSTQPLSVHPHVHGELRSSRFWQAARAGSSPRAWGTPDRDRP